MGIEYLFRGQLEPLVFQSQTSNFTDGVHAFLGLGISDEGKEDEQKDK